MRTLKWSWLLCLLVWWTPGYTIMDFRDAWRVKYPDSRADDIGPEILNPMDKGCQLCHRDDDGNEPWNAYGWAVRTAYYTNGFDITDAIDEAEDFNQDNDPQGVSSLDEITRSFQPGWTLGNSNTIYYVNGSTDINQPPPFVPPTTDIDFPADVITDLVPDVSPGNIEIGLYEVAGNFNAPLQAVRAPGIDGSLFVVEQTGKIYRVDLLTGDKTLFHDAGSDLVALGGGSDERGLLGLAFHPNYAANGFFYTYQSEPRRPEQDAEVDFSTVAPSTNLNHRSMVVEYQAANPGCNSSIRKIKNLLIVDQPQGNHNGGDLAFGPDGYLYIAFGDGGGAHDQGFGHGSLGTGRDNTNPLGAILRIDPLGTNSARGKYGVPNDNPFVGIGDTGVDEIFAYGFRNPFRISFDANTGDLYAGDVGQGDLEEIDMVTKGGNYGWNWKEGSFFFYNSLATGNFVSTVAPPGLPASLQDPIAEYDHDDGISVIGGYVYRGTQVPAIGGRYVFGDFLKRLFYLDASQQVKEFLGSGTADFITGFGQDANNELYVVTRVQSGTSGVAGKLQKIVVPGSGYSAPAAAGESAQCPPTEDICFPVKGLNAALALICL